MDRTEDHVTYLGVGDVSRILRRHRNTVRRYEKKGILPPALRDPVSRQRRWRLAVIEEARARLEPKGQ